MERQYNTPRTAPRLVLWTILLACALSCVLLPAPEASAERRASLEEGPIVRRKLLFRSNRLEIMPQIGATINTPYKQNLLGGVEVNFYFNNEFGIGASGMFGGLKFNTDLLDQIEAVQPSEEQANQSYATTTALVDIHLSYVPLFGKFSIYRNDIHYDIHLLAGFGGALVGAEGENADAAQFTGFSPAPMVGGGGRLFFGDDYALSIALKNYIYSAADIQTGELEPETEIRSNYALMIGFSIFTGNVAVSR